MSKITLAYCSRSDSTVPNRSPAARASLPTGVPSMPTTLMAPLGIFARLMASMAPRAMSSLLQITSSICSGYSEIHCSIQADAWLRSQLAMPPVSFSRGTPPSFKVWMDHSVRIRES